MDGIFTDSCVNVKPAEVYGAENPLWTREDGIYRELGTRLCSVEAIHGILKVGGSCNCAVGKLVLIRSYLISAAKPSMALFRLPQFRTREVKSDCLGCSSCAHYAQPGGRLSSVPSHSTCYGSRCWELDTIRVPRGDRERGIQDGS